jgi:hypothetical protein
MRKRNGGTNRRGPGRDGAILALALRAAPRLLREAGEDPARIASRVGLDLRLLDDPEAVVPFSIMGRFFAECVAATKCPHFGLRVGSEEGFTALGVLGHLVQHSPHVRAALHTLTVYLHHQEIGAVATLSVDNGVAAVDYTIQQPGIVAADQIADGAMGIAAAIMRYMCGPAWSPIEVQLMHAAPQDPAPYRRILGTPVRFGAERNAMLFSAKWLDRSLSGADPGLRQILHDKIAELETQRAADFPTQLSTIIRTMLLAGQSSVDSWRRLAVNRRTLHRRLGASPHL